MWSNRNGERRRGAKAVPSGQGEHMILEVSLQGSNFFDVCCRTLFARVICWEKMA